MCRAGREGARELGKAGRVKRGGWGRCGWAARPPLLTGQGWRQLGHSPPHYQFDRVGEDAIQGQGQAGRCKAKKLTVGGSAEVPASFSTATGTPSRGTAVVGLQPYWSIEGTRALVAPQCHRGDVWPGLRTRRRCTQSCAYRCTREVTHSSQGKSGVEGRVTLGARSMWPPHTEASSSMGGPDGRGRGTLLPRQACRLSAASAFLRHLAKSTGASGARKAMTCTGHSGAEHTREQNHLENTRPPTARGAEWLQKSHTRPELLPCRGGVQGPPAAPWAPSSPGRPAHCPQHVSPEPKRRDIRS